MNRRKTLIRLGLVAAILFMCNLLYTGQAFYRPYAWLFAGLDATFIACAIVAFVVAPKTAQRQ